jgi:hypothetical protein
VCTTLAGEEGLLFPTTPAAAQHPSWFGRALAFALAVVAAPGMVVNAALRKAGGKPALPWVSSQAVVGCDPETGALRLRVLRFARPALGSVSRVVAADRPLLDVMMGRRRWIGARPRRTADWHVLHADWQAMLGGAPVGWLHAPAWVSAQDCPIEAPRRLTWPGWRGPMACAEPESPQRPCVTPWWRRSWDARVDERRHRSRRCGREAARALRGRMGA